jgi:PAS domain S-box-containing protein
VLPLYDNTFFKSLYDQIPLGIGVLHTETASFVYLNKLAKEQYLCQLPMHFSDFMRSKLRIPQEEAQKIEETIKKKKSIKRSLISDPKKSSWAQLVVEPMLDNNSFSVMYLSDLSAAVQSEEILLKEIQRFEALFNYASIGIILVNREGIIAMINGFANKQFGYENGELIGKQIEVLIPQRFHKAHVAHRSGFEKKPEARTMGIGLELFAIRKNGSEFPVQISLGHFHNEEGSFTLAYIFDDTDRKRNELSLLKQQEEMALVNAQMKQLNESLEIKVYERTDMLQEALKELEKSRDEITQALEKEKELNDMKTRFVSMASHEFRTPLSTILSSVTLLSKYILTEEQGKREKHIDRIKGAVTNLTDILNEFLSLGKIEDGKVEPKWMPFSIKESVTDVIRQMDPLKKSGQWINHIHNGHEETVLDPSLLKNILINLLSNALKFSPEHSIIEINTSVHTEGIRIIVKDKGIGISKEDQEHLFERFFRGANAANIQGTGLGLHIVSRYIQLMKGNIRCESILEEGTSFIVEFPQKILTDKTINFDIHQ